MKRKREIVQMEPQQQKETKVRKKTIQLPIPGETWELVLGWLWRHNLASSTSFVPGLVGAFSMRILHEKRRRKLGPITFHWMKRGIPNKNGIEPTHLYTNNERVAPPNCAVYNSIVGFEHIKFYYFTQEVLLFLRRMRPLLRDVNIILDFESIRQLKPLTALAHVLPLCSTVNSLTTYLSLLNELSTLHPRLLNESRLMVIKLCTEDSKMAILAEWLFSTPLEDGSPKLLAVEVNYPDELDEFYRIVKRYFFAAKQSAPFLVHFRGTYFDFEMQFENTVTGDRFSVYGTAFNCGWRDYRWYGFMRCCPTADWDNATKWLASEEKLMCLLPYWRIHIESIDYPLEEVLEFCVDKIGPINGAESEEDGHKDDEETEDSFGADVPGTGARKKKRI